MFNCIDLKNKDALPMKKDSDTIIFDWHKKAQLEFITNIIEDNSWKEEHICRFNDGECDCECYKQTLQDIKKLISNL